MHYDVNKVKDLVERVFWTFTNTFVGLVIAQHLIGANINLSTVHQLEGAALAALLTSIKTFAAQNLGKNNDGAAIPGGIINQGGAK